MATSDSGELFAADLAEAEGAGLLLKLANAPEPTYRFRHALIQEAIYRGMLRDERSFQHGRAALALEQRQRAGSQRWAVVLARHFAAAGEHEQAVHFFEMAGDHALRAFANDEAIILFRSALEVAKQEGSRVPALAAPPALGLGGKLAQVLWRTGKRDEVDSATGCHHVGWRVRCSWARRSRSTLPLGQMAVDENRFAEARVAYGTAEKLLGDRPQERDGQAVRNLWLEVMISGWAQFYCQAKEPELAERGFRLPVL